MIIEKQHDERIRELKDLSELDKFRSLARHRGYIKKEVVLKLIKKYNFLCKDKLIKEIRKL